MFFSFTSRNTCQFLKCACQLTCIYFLCKFLHVKREKLAKTFSNIYTVVDDLVEFEKWPIGVRDFGKCTDHCSTGELTLVSRSHENSRHVWVVKLLRIVLRSRCWLTTFHTVLTGDVDKWCLNWPVWLAPRIDYPNFWAVLLFGITQSFENKGGSSVGCSDIVEHSQ